MSKTKKRQVPYQELDKAYCKYSAEFNKETEPDILGILTEKHKIRGKDVRHTISKVPRTYPDTCTEIAIWKYEVMRNGNLITSENPITTDPVYAKVPELPCIISCSLFGSDSKYIDGIDNFCDNIKTIGLLD